MLVQETLTGKVDKVQKAIDRIRAFEPRDGYLLAFSGGKDSQCVYHLAKMSGVRFEPHYYVTTVDPPELLRFIREQYPDVIWDYPFDKDGRRTCMYRLIAERTIPPTRMVRYCCTELKESKTLGHLVITGVRWAESNNRRTLHGVVNIGTTSKKLINGALNNNPAAKLNNHNTLVFMDDNEESRRMVEHCYVSKRTSLNPIVDWDDSDVWEFLNDVVKVPHCSLYDEGHLRIGCVGCPLQGGSGMQQEFERWPGYKRMYINAFNQMIKNHPGEIRYANSDIAESGGGERLLVEWIEKCGH